MATNRSYVGPAVLITTSGQLAVEASLRVEQAQGLASWMGHVDASPSEDFWSVIEDGSGVLRMPDGQEGAFIPAGTVAGSGQLRITGSGPAPF